MAADIYKGCHRRWGGRVLRGLPVSRLHVAIMATGLFVILTGVSMMFRVRTIFFPRNPYLFGNMTWGMMYVLAGVGLITLVLLHVYFSIRPEKLDVTKSMIFGSMKRDFCLKHYDPTRWTVEGINSPSKAAAKSTEI